MRFPIPGLLSATISPSASSGTRRLIRPRCLSASAAGPAMLRMPVIAPSPTVSLQCRGTHMNHFRFV